MLLIRNQAAMLAISSPAPQLGSPTKAHVSHSACKHMHAHMLHTDSIHAHAYSHGDTDECICTYLDTLVYFCTHVYICIFIYPYIYVEYAVHILTF